MQCCDRANVSLDRAAAKDKRCQWDPPRISKPYGIVRFRGKGNDGVSLISSHYLDWRRATESVIAPSDFEQDAAAHLQTLSSQVNVCCAFAAAEATPEERVALAALTMMAGIEQCVGLAPHTHTFHFTKLW
jgi:hypothetical protein